MVKKFISSALLIAAMLEVKAQDSVPAKPAWNKTLLAVPTLGTGPETGFYGGAAATLDLAPAADSSGRHSVLSSEITYTAKKQFIISGNWDITNLSKDYILFGENSWMKFPELYWGIGGKTAAENELLYDAYRIEMENGFYHRLGKNLFAGIDQQFQSVYSLQLPSKTEKTEAILNQMKQGNASGFGMGILLDTRSNLLSPRAGEYFVLLHGLYFGKIFGSDFSFPHAHTDLRCYLPLGKNQILALQATGEFFGEGSPFRLQALLGGSMMLRGFYRGRYRDHNQLSAQAEFRTSLWRWLGAAAFGSFGDAFSFQHPERNGRLKSSAGAGIRIRIDKKENTSLRFDYAITSDRTSGFYVSFGEAF